jgi:hypothetical protein
MRRSAMIAPRHYCQFRFDHRRNSNVRKSQRSNEYFIARVAANFCGTVGTVGGSQACIESNDGRIRILRSKRRELGGKYLTPTGTRFTNLFLPGPKPAAGHCFYEVIASIQNVQIGPIAPVLANREVEFNYKIT